MNFNLIMIPISIGGIIFSIMNSIDDYKDYKENKEQYLKNVKHFPADYLTNILYRSTKTYKQSYTIWLLATISWFICLLINLFIVL